MRYCMEEGASPEEAQTRAVTIHRAMNTLAVAEKRREAKQRRVMAALRQTAGGLEP